MSIKPMVIAKEKIPTRRAQVRAWMRVFLVVITFSGAIALLVCF
jgi:hypothetical protein